MLRLACILLCMLTFVSFSACAPGNPAALRQSAAIHASIIVERDARSAYKNLRAGLEECYGPTRADFFESEGSGWIKISMPSFASGEAILLYYDLMAQGQNATLIEGYAAHNFGSWPSLVRNTAHWARGEAGCP